MRSSLYVRQQAWIDNICEDVITLSGRSRIHCPEKLIKKFNLGYKICGLHTIVTNSFGNPRRFRTSFTVLFETS